jgi:hypothetical protein
MAYCKECKINIVSETVRCPLCHKELQIQDGEVLIKAYPDYVPRKSPDVFSLICMILAITSISLSVLINVLTLQTHFWSAIVTVYVLYAWLLGKLTFNPRIHAGFKLLAHAIAIPCSLIVVNVFAQSSVAMSKITWAISYAMPLTFVGFILMTLLVIYRKRYDRRDFIVYQLSLCVLAFIPILLVIFRVIEPMIPSIIAAIVSAITITGMLLFGRKSVKTEFRRKFHI